MIIEPVSVPKAKRLAALLRAGLPIHAVTPNRDELAALVGFPVKTDAALTRAVRLRCTAAACGMCWSGWGRRAVISPSTHDDMQFCRDCPRTAQQVRDVTGGGDAMVAGFAYGLARGKSAAQAARIGSGTRRPCRAFIDQRRAATRSKGARVLGRP